MKTLNFTIADSTHEKLMQLKKRWNLGNISEVITKAIELAIKSPKWTEADGQ